jgi:hypothetical protein
VIIFRSDDSCRVPMHLGPVAGDLCNSHACDARVEDIRFKLGNCSDRSTLDCCFLDVKERPFYEQELRLSGDFVQDVRVFFVDVHLHGNRLRACHRWCTVKLVSVEGMLSTFTEFLRLNPKVVLIQRGKVASSGLHGLVPSLVLSS